MNIEKLKLAEEQFLMRYPGGYHHPEIQEIIKKHKIEKLTAATKEWFDLYAMKDVDVTIGAMVKLISRSSLVSVFEKPKFKDAVNLMTVNEKELLVQGLKDMLHGDQSAGFSIMTGVLMQYKIAKWPIITAIPYYYNPTVEVLIKPTTVKGVIEYFELKGIKYSSTPNYTFYAAYREMINSMKKQLRFGEISEDNGGFCGFLMMSLENYAK